MRVTQESIGHVNGREVVEYTLDNGHMQVRVLNYGAIISAVLVPAHGEMRNVVLNYANLDGYVDDLYYVGCVVGRFANRIRDAQFIIKGATCHLSLNEPALHNHIHGGFRGFNRKVYDEVDVISGKDQIRLKLLTRSAHKEEGYPGNLEVGVSYALNSHNELHVEFTGISDMDTHVNLTQHTYFQLNPPAAATFGHRLQVHARRFLEMCDRFLPSGKVMCVQGSPYDLTQEREVSVGKGVNRKPLFNTYYIRDDEKNEYVASLGALDDSVRMKLYTTYPGMLVYTGDYLGKPFKAGQGICLECQHAPDSPNLPGFGTSLLHAGETFKYITRYHFDWSN